MVRRFGGTKLDGPLECLQRLALITLPAVCIAGDTEEGCGKRLRLLQRFDKAEALVDASLRQEEPREPVSGIGVRGFESGERKCPDGHPERAAGLSKCEAV